MRCPTYLLGMLSATALILCIGGDSVSAKDHVLVVRVKDTGQHPFPGVEIGLDGEGGPPQKTDANGKAELALGLSTKPLDLVSLLIASSPPGLDLVMIDPYQHPVRVPGFEDNTNNYVPVTVASRGDKNILESGSGMLAIRGALTRRAAVRRRKNQGFLPFGTLGFRLASYPAKVSSERDAGLDVKHFNAEGADAEFDPDDVLQVSKLFQLSPDSIRSALDYWGHYSLGWRLLMAKSATYGTVVPFAQVFNTNGLRFGIGDWTLQECTLQPLLLKFSAASPDTFSAIIGKETKSLIASLRQPCSESAAQLYRLFHSPDGQISPDWMAKLKELGSEEAFERIEVDEAVPLFNSATKCAVDVGLRSELAVTFCFNLNRWFVDERVLAAAREEASSDNAAFEKQKRRPADQLEKLYIFVNRVGDPHNYRSDSSRAISMLSRFIGLSIAEGRSSSSPRYVELEDLGLGMRNFETGEPLMVHHDENLLRDFRAGWLPSEPDRMVWHP